MTTSAGGAEPVGTTVVLFTLDYPFGEGEPFLEPEVRVLADRFDRVIIVPSATGASDRTIRDVPVNAVVIAPSGGGALRAVARQAMRHPIQTLAAFFGSISAQTSVRGKLQELKFRIAVSIRSNAVLRTIPAMGLLRAHCVFYAYWLDLPVGVAIDVRQRAGLAHIPIVSRAHGFDVYAERHASNYLPQREEILRGISQVFSVSRAGYDYLRRRWPAYSEKISVARLGARAAVNPGNADQDANTVVSCSFILPVKRLELLIDSLAELQSRGRGVRWRHIGPVDTAYSAAVQLRAEQFLAPGSFEFVGGLDNEGVRDWYANNPASAFINVSASEGVPVSIMEGLAQGLPILATDVGGNSETIDPASGMFDGLLPADPSPEDVADRIEALLRSDRTEYRRWADASFDHWKRTWSSDVNHSSFVANLAEIALSTERPMTRAE
ncbi:glycosyltransferase [Microbacterium luteolum]|uniref:Glycosyltransferase n=1 Tax=Microbacterium luteolum TaxID=69367 RepID=A0ABY7XQ15_MICLT|nr:glycosyltransferase [Microbacterium luteolum]WDM44132.1 glycosyltransferase [Microbacterium luteolum]